MQTGETTTATAIKSLPGYDALKVCSLLVVCGHHNGYHDYSKNHWWSFCFWEVLLSDMLTYSVG